MTVEKREAVTPASSSASSSKTSTKATTKASHCSGPDGSLEGSAAEDGHIVGGLVEGEEDREVRVLRVGQDSGTQDNDEH